MFPLLFPAMNAALRGPNFPRIPTRGLQLGVFILAVMFHLPFLGSGWGPDHSFFLETVRPFDDFNPFGYFDPTWGWYYRPVFLFYFAALRTVFGDNPPAFHAVALVLHGIVAWLVVDLARHFKATSPEAVGAAFAVVTMRNQAPGWIAAGSIVLAALCVLGALLLWIRFTDAKPSHKWWFYIGSLLCFAMGLGCKEEVAALPVALLWVDIRFRPNLSWRRRIVSFVPLAAISLAYLFLALVAYRHSTRFHTPVSVELPVIVALVSGAFGHVFRFWHPIVSAAGLGLIFWRAARFASARLAMQCLAVFAVLIACSVGSYAIQGDTTISPGSRFYYISSLFAAFVLAEVLLSPIERGYKSYPMLWISWLSYAVSLPLVELTTNIWWLQILVLVSFVIVAVFLRRNPDFAWWQIVLSGAFLSTFPNPAVLVFAALLLFYIYRVRGTNFARFLAASPQMPLN